MKLENDNIHHTLTQTPASLVTPFPNSEHKNNPSSNLIYTNSTPNHIQTTMSLCNTHTHDTHNLFNCTHIRTTLSPLDLWTDPAGMMELMARWIDKLAGGPKARTSDSPTSKGHGSG